MDTPPQSFNRYNPELEELRFDYQQRANQKAKIANSLTLQQSEKDQVARMITEMRRKLKYIDETNWMYENVDM